MMRLASYVFWAFAALIALSITAIFILNPRSHSLSFVAKTLVIFGGILAWAVSSALALRKGVGLMPATILVKCYADDRPITM
jgi:hypothetical protein